LEDFLTGHFGLEKLDTPLIPRTKGVMIGCVPIVVDHMQSGRVQTPHFLDDMIVTRTPATQQVQHRVVVFSGDSLRQLGFEVQQQFHELLV